VRKETADGCKGFFLENQEIFHFNVFRDRSGRLGEQIIL